MRRTLALLAGSCVVYVLAAACGGGAGSGIVAAVLSPDAAPEASLPGAEGGAGGGAIDASVAQPDVPVATDAATVAEAEATAPGTSGSAVGGDTGSRDVLAVPDAKAEPQTSGTRLKARWIVGDDGSRQFSVWWDAKLGVECQFQDGGDGKRYCLPTIQGMLFGQTLGRKPTLSVGYLPCEVKFLVVPMDPKPACGNFIGRPTVYNAKSVESSDPVENPYAGRAYYLLTDPVPLSTFVSASVVTDP
jgi:hypothetical protein